jgi:hypothetical protein
VTAGIFEIMLGANKTIGPEKPGGIGGHSFGPIVEVSTLDMVEDVGVLCTHRRVRGRSSSF